MEFHEYVSDRLKAIQERPSMWGSPEAIELQALLLLEAEVQHYAPDALQAEPRIVMNAYTKELRNLFGHGNKPLHLIFEASKEYERILYEICQKIRFDIGSKLTIWGADYPMRIHPAFCPTVDIVALSANELPVKLKEALNLSPTREVSIKAASVSRETVRK